ncbi:ESF2 [Symbiodinium microadriaticum]|nr:ESF2 [Symbiodinium microadriaticum]
MGGRKRSFYHDDIWNIKYLKHFKWDNLTEKFAYERRVRENKLRAAMLQAKKQNAEFEEMVAKEKAYQHVNERKRKRGEISNTADDPDAENAGGTGAKSTARRKFKQIKPIAQKGGELDRNRVSKKLVKSVFASEDS